MRIASFDIGKANFAQYVEEVDISQIDKLREQYINLPKKEQRRTKGPISSKMQKIINGLLKCGKRIHVSVHNLKATEEDVLDIQTRKNILNHLKLYDRLWKDVDLIVIEQQFFNIYGGRGQKQKTRGANMDAIKIGELVSTFFLMNYPEKEIVIFGSMFKTQMLGAPNKQTKAQRKKWSVEKATELFQMRGDEKMLTVLNTRGIKKDDMCDAVLQCKAYLLKYRIACF